MIKGIKGKSMTGSKHTRNHELQVYILYAQFQLNYSFKCATRTARASYYMYLCSTGGQTDAPMDAYTPTDGHFSDHISLITANETNNKAKVVLL